MNRESYTLECGQHYMFKRLIDCKGAALCSSFFR